MQIAMPPHAEQPPPDQPDTPAYVAVARVIGAWGLHGDLKVELLTDFPQRLAAGSRVFMSGVPYVIEGYRQHRGRALLKLAGIDSTSAAEPLRHRVLQVPETELHPLAEGEFYHFQIIGLEVRTTTGEVLGRVDQIISTGSNDVYVVRGARGEILIPAIDDVVKRVDPGTGQIEVDVVEGLLPARSRPSRRTLNNQEQ
jgi:16S rRNA processing protein RimM